MESTFTALAEVCERVVATSKKTNKIAVVSGYFREAEPGQAAAAAVFLSGRPFPMWDEMTLQVGGSLLWQAIQSVGAKSEGALTAAYRRLGDIGAVAADLLPQPSVTTAITPTQLQVRFRQIAQASGSSARLELVKVLLAEISPLEAKYVVKIMTGDLRIGLKESLVEDAIAHAFAADSAQVSRANMLLGDIGETLQLASSGRLQEAKMRLFHPLGAMLASPVASAAEALEYIPNPFIEDKYDGVRAQVHASRDRVRIFSRTREDTTNSFPEVRDALLGSAQDFILDGEIVAWSDADDDSDSSGRALPFSVLQQRIGRKKVSEKMMRDCPVAFVAFDVLYANGSLTIDLPLTDRGRILDEIIGGIKRKRAVREQQALILRAPVFHASKAGELDELFDAAQSRGNEGLMIKDANSAYSPGRRGKSWLKLKRELATLDVVVTAVEYGHGKRIRVLSDYTFAVRDGERLVNIGKAYSGLTDVEIAEMTKWFLDHTIEDQGFRRVVEPKIVLEVAFNNMMLSDRHESGYALRFPRIVRLRPDKLAEEADTIERAREIFENQGKS